MYGTKKGQDKDTHHCVGFVFCGCSSRECIFQVSRERKKCDSSHHLHTYIEKAKTQDKRQKTPALFLKNYQNVILFFTRMLTCEFLAHFRYSWRGEDELREIHSKWLEPHSNISRLVPLVVLKDGKSWPSLHVEDTSIGESVWGCILSSSSWSSSSVRPSVPHMYNDDEGDDVEANPAV